MTSSGESIFPPRAPWFTRGRALAFFWRGSDEWGRHTIVLQVPWLGGVVIPTRACTEPEMAEFRCTWPGCPYHGIVPGEFCPTHDPEWLNV